MKIFDWISNIIDSCTDDFHFEAVDNLVQLFHEREKDDAQRDELILRRRRKWNDIHGIVAPEFS